MTEPTIDSLLRLLVRDAVGDAVRAAVRDELGTTATSGARRGHC